MNSLPHETNTLIEQQRQQLENNLRQGSGKIVRELIWPW